MKLKSGFLLREVAGESVVIPLGGTAGNFGGMLRLNETGKLLWAKLEKGASREELLAAVLAEYEVEENVAAADIDKFLQKLQQNGMLEEE